MADVLAFPGRGAHFIDARGGHRALRATWHHDDGMVVLSLWRGDECTGSFRLLAEDVPALLATLTDGLAAGYSATTRSAAALGQG